MSQVKLRHEHCLVCERIAAIAEGSNPFFVAEREMGYVVLGDYQFFRGYTVFLCKVHALDLHDLEPTTYSARKRGGFCGTHEGG